MQQQAMLQKSVPQQPTQSPQKKGRAGTPVQMRPDFEPRAGQSFADIRVHYRPAPHSDCVQRIRDRNGQQSIKWPVFVRRLPADVKVRVRRKLSKEYTAEEKENGVECGPFVLEKSDFDSRPRDITDFYEKITPHMKDSRYWIECATYATGDLPSLTAAIINSTRHGIAMCKRDIGEAHPLKNMEILREFLGGAIDQEGENIYVVTDEGAQGRWGRIANSSSNAAGGQQSEPMDWRTFPESEQGYAWLEETAFEYLETGKIWLYIAKLVEDKGGGEIAGVIKELVGAYSETMQMISRIIDSDLELDLMGLLPVKIKEIMGREEQAFEVLPPSERLQRLIQDRQKVQGDLRIERDIVDFLKRLYTYAVYFHEGVCQVRKFVEDVLSGNAQPPENADGNAQPPENADGNGLPSENMRPQIKKLGFTYGTRLVAIGWDQKKRERVRKAWGLVESGEKSSNQDRAIKMWLRQKKSIDPAKAIYRKKIVVLWIRKSGERGGAHFENDTSFKILRGKARAYRDEGYVVFLAGDYKEGKGIENIEPGIYNITEFWNQSDELLEAWGGDTRTGQYRLYDYLKRKSNSLIHVGAMSGNLEAMALMGHSVIPQVHSPEDSGVSRMTAYEVHDLYSAPENKIGYNLNYKSFGGQEGYDKKAANYYVPLKQYAKGFLGKFEITEFIKEFESTLSSVNDSDHIKLILEAFIRELVNGKTPEELLGKIQADPLMVPQEEIDKIEYTEKLEKLYTELCEVKGKDIDFVQGCIIENPIKVEVGSIKDKLLDQYVNHILIQVAKWIPEENCIWQFQQFLNFQESQNPRKHRKSQKHRESPPVPPNQDIRPNPQTRRRVPARYARPNPQSQDTPDTRYVRRRVQVRQSQDTSEVPPVQPNQGAPKVRQNRDTRPNPQTQKRRQVRKKQ